MPVSTNSVWPQLMRRLWGPCGFYLAGEAIGLWLCCTDAVQMQTIVVLQSGWIDVLEEWFEHVVGNLSTWEYGDEHGIEGRSC